MPTDDRPPLEILTAPDDARVESLRAAGEFFWLDLVDPTDDEVHAAGARFDLHPLSVEDTLAFGQRPKVDEYGDYALLVLYGAAAGDARSGDDAIDLVEVHVYVHGDFVLTIRRGPCPSLDQLRETLRLAPPRVEHGVVYRIVDALVDTFFPVLAGIDDRIDALEDAIIEQASTADLQELFALKRQLVHLRKVVTPQRDLLARATDRIAEVPGLEHDAHDYFRDVYDHMIRISDMVDTYRDLLTGAMDVYLSTVANRQNDVMKQMSLVATIFLPLTFVTGFFGQNFGWMVDHVATAQDFLLWGFGGLVVSGALLTLFFWRRGWF